MRQAHALLSDQEDRLTEKDRQAETFERRLAGVVEERDALVAELETFNQKIVRLSDSMSNAGASAVCA